MVVASMLASPVNWSNTSASAYPACTCQKTTRRVIHHHKKAVNKPEPVILEGYGVRLEPLSPDHHDGLIAAASDGCLWNLWYTFVPEPPHTTDYIAAALAAQEAGHMLPWAVKDLATQAIAGSTRYHDIVTSVDRVEIGYTWYGTAWQRSHINTACKLLLLDHAFRTLGCKVVGLRTDNFNFASQRAILALGAKQDGIIRHHKARRDGTVGDTVMFSMLAGEWPDVRRHLELRLLRHGCPDLPSNEASSARTTTEAFLRDRHNV